ncbi:MAG: hypothetical protein COW59_12560 [Lysobacterales bacterium CG17_big_fil_post_rev_8_21_14_2_50_64_11]|nr:MAG: hypothetical protein COW59_12560 [Xanthomonadales bacterium CG17_big_fil_post_rev_8_21_14_2_50_64_11]
MRDSQTTAAAGQQSGGNALLIVLSLALVLGVAAQWLPQGMFLPDQPLSMASYRAVEHSETLSFFAGDGGKGLMNVLFEGLVSGSRNSAAVGVVAFLLIVGGTFGVIHASGALERLIEALVTHTEDRPTLLIITLIGIFSTGGAVLGMGEETIAFLALLLPVFQRIGLTPVVAVLCTYGASQVGFATSWMNPFSVAIAQTIAGLPLYSGSELRMLVWLAATVFTMLWVVALARRTRAPVVSVPLTVPTRQHAIAVTDIVIVSAVIGCIAWIVVGVTRWHFYIGEIASQFFTLAVAVALVARLSGRLSLRASSDAFATGAAQLAPTVLVIAAAKGMLWLFGGSDVHSPSSLNALLYHAAHLLQGLPPMLAAQGMLATQSLFNFFVTSGSAQAAITMPLMAGLGDLLGVSRQIAVLAFQFGDGFSNLLVPTSSAMMGALGVAGVSWTHWLRCTWKLTLLLLLIAALGIAVASEIGYA